MKRDRAAQVQTAQELSIEMTDDKALTGGQEKIVRTVERTLAAQARRDQPGVKITNLASGKTQVEVHAYDDDLRTAGDAARDEFDRQMGTTSVPTAELDRMVWLASIGQAALDKGLITPHEAAPAPAVVTDTNVTNFEIEVSKPTYVVEGDTDVSALTGLPHDIPAGPGKRVRKPVQATGDPTADLLEKMRAATEGDGHA